MSCSSSRALQHQYSLFNEKLNKEIALQECSEELLNEIDKFFYLKDGIIDTSTINSSLEYIVHKIGTKRIKSSSGDSITLINCQTENNNCETCIEIYFALSMANYSKQFREHELKERIEIIGKAIETYDTERIDRAYYLRNHLLRTKDYKDLINAYNNLNNLNKQFLLGSDKIEKNKLIGHIDSMRVNCRLWKR